MRRVVGMMNKHSGDRKISEDMLSSSFEAMWPKLEAAIEDVLSKPGAPAPSRARTDRELLEEILNLTRARARSAPSPRSRVSRLAVRDLKESLDALSAKIASEGLDHVIADELALLRRVADYLTGIAEPRNGVREISLSPIHDQRPEPDGEGPTSHEE